MERVVYAEPKSDIPLDYAAARALEYFAAVQAENPRAVQEVFRFKNVEIELGAMESEFSVCEKWKEAAQAAAQ